MNSVNGSVKPVDDASSQKRSFVATYGLTDKDYAGLPMPAGLWV